MKTPIRIVALIFFLVGVTAVGTGYCSNIKVLATEGKGCLLDVDGGRVLMVRGSPYEMGYQQGKLLAKDVNDVVHIMLSVSYIADAVREKSLFANSLEKALKKTQPFMPARYEEEMKGLADGAQLPVQEVRLANIFPEQFHCSGFALFGKATRDGQLLHGRVLDYMTGIGLQRHAVVTVAQPDGLNAFVTVGYAGFIGSVTGMNQKEIAIGEMGGRGEGNWDGMPMSFLVRKALEEANSLEQAVTIFRTTPRTCEYYYVVSDGKIPDARGLACTPKMFDVIEPNKFNTRLNKPIADAVVLSAGSRYDELVARVKKHYGTFDDKAAMELMTRPVAMESNLHDVLFKPSRLELWAANAAEPSAENYQACYQKYYHYDLKELLQFNSEKSKNKN